VAAVRAELASIEPARRCCRIAERAGLGRAAHGGARSPAIGRLAVRLGDGIDEGSPGSPPVVAEFDWQAAATHCRIAWLRGAFLARGSLSLAAGRTHLELVVPIDETEPLAERLAHAGLPTTTRVRRGRGVVTAKSSEAVVVLLRRLGSTAATLELESRLVARALRGHMNRVLNAETANLARSVASARRQLADIQVLADSRALERLAPAVRAVARARLAAPEATFSELAEQLGTSRALVQRAFEQIAGRALEAESRQPNAASRQPNAESRQRKEESRQRTR
jgi:DNA-binding transcriptional regulator WhiA